MINATVCEVGTIARIDHKEAMAIAAAENAKFGAQLRSLDDGDWTRPTDCPLWDVRAVAAHVVGSAAGQASLREFLRQKRMGKPIVAEIGGQFWWDGMNQVQVREREQLTVAEILAEWDVISPKAIKARSGMPRPIAALPLLGLPQPVGRQPLRYLFDVGFTRDVWAHRIDIAHATGKDLDLDASHDGRILADLIAEWAGMHRKPFVLELSGPAGGSFESGTGGEHIEMDAVEFVRILAERSDGPGILQHKLPL